MSVPASVLRTPHRGYHWPGGLWQPKARRFFEGWYYRVSLPERHLSFAFMYSIEDPQGGTATSGGFVQVLGPGDGRAHRLLPDVAGFWAETGRLALGHREPGPAGWLEPALFERSVINGYQATDALNQGCFSDPTTGEVVRWCYTIRPVWGWGGVERDRPTMGALSYLSVFEPGWQILMSHGLATGWIEWRGERHHFTDAPAYGEKNWGGAFPDKWFWVQANDFGSDPRAALVAGGGLRGVLWWQEAVAMVSLYAGGRFYRFMPGEAQVHSSVTPWGSWQLEAEDDRYRVSVRGRTSVDMGIELLAPTLAGPRYVCRDTLFGRVTVRLERRSGAVLFEDETDLGGLETGGGPWPGEWTFSCER